MAENVPYNEKALLSLIMEGDEKAFTRLFKIYYPQLKPFLVKYSGSEADADEIIQETFIRIWMHRDRLPELENFHGWIFKVASREYLTWVKKNLQARKSVDSMDRKQRQEGQGFNPVTPLEQTHLRELNQLVREAVKELPEQRKKIYRMSREEGLKIAEIADQLKLSESTVKNVLTTVLKHIRDYLTRHGHPFMVLIWLLEIKK